MAMFKLKEVENNVGSFFQLSSIVREQPKRPMECVR